MKGVAHPTILGSLLRLVPAALIAAGAVLVACGADPNDAALPGQSLASGYGCMACHSPTGAVGVGPAWNGLYGSTVELDDGTTVTVDREFLVRAITDPAAQVPKGNKVPMPVNNVPDADVQAIVDYIISLK